MMRRALAPLSCIALLAACSGGAEREPAPVSFQGTQPNARPSAPAAPLNASGPDARGVVFNDGYETIIARNGDTVDAVAARVGITGAELSAYNGLPTTYRPQAGDELVLPAKPGGYRTGAVTAATAPLTATAPASAPQLAPTSTVPTPTPIATTAIGAEPVPAAPAPAAPASTWSASSIAAAIDDTSPSASTLEPTNEPVAAAPAAVPAAVAPTPQPAAPAPKPPAPVLVEPVQQAAVAAPAVATPAVQVPAASSARFVSPVDAPIVRPFSKLPGPNRNDGVDFASPAGLDVRAADAGTVALVSNSLGGLGTIVLIRHEGGLLTVYGRIDGVTVQKGDKVARGQSFARVADLPAPREPSLHFEVRRGAESVDPAGFI